MKWYSKWLFAGALALDIVGCRGLELKEADADLGHVQGMIEHYIGVNKIDEACKNDDDGIVYVGGIPATCFTTDGVDKEIFNTLEQMKAYGKANPYIKNFIEVKNGKVQRVLYSPAYRVIFSDDTIID